MASANRKIGRHGNKHLAVVLASTAILTAGCANMTTTAITSPLSSAATFSGRVHGGNQPVALANVQLYAVGQTGVGSAATLYATTQTSNDGTGTFHFVKTGGTGGPSTSGSNTYGCPAITQANPDPLLYIYSRGGNTQNTGTSTQNTSAAFIAPVGFCSQISNATFVDVSEVTTAATVAATAQFINPSTESIGNDGTGVGYQAVSNAFRTVATLVNASTGTANGSTTISGANVSNGVGVTGVTITATPGTSKINTVADILSTCVNQPTQNGANCTALFQYAVPPTSPSQTSQPSATFPAAADTVQAALYMFLNPTDSSTSNRTALFNLVPGTGAPYQPTITSVPTDWTLAITYATANTCGAQNSTFFSHPYDLNLDVNGNIWLANNGGSNSALVEITNSGAPTTCVSLGGTSMGGGIVDIAGNVWYVDNASTIIFRYTPGTGAVQSYSTAGLSTGSGTATISPLDITTDGSGNTFFSGTSGGAGYVYKIPSGSTSSPIPVSATAGPTPARLFPDTAGDIWVTSGAGYVSQIVSTTNSGNLNGYQTTAYSVPSPSYGVIVGSSNQVYVTSQDAGSSLTVLAPSNSGYAVQSGFPTPSNTAGLSTPTGIWLDGAQNAWIGDHTAESSGLYAVSVVGVNGSAISASGLNGGYQKASSYLNGVRGMLVDQVGNVWITNDNNPNTITEIVGAAVPILGPYSYALQQSRFQTIP